MPGYTVVSIKGGYVDMEKRDGHGGVSKTGLSVEQFEDRFDTEPVIGVKAENV